MMRWSDIQSCRHLNKQFAVARNCETFSYLVSYTVAVRWIEWSKVERDLVILCLVPCMRYRGAAPQERSATGAKYQGIFPPVCLHPSGAPPLKRNHLKVGLGAALLGCRHTGGSMPWYRAIIK